MSKKDISNLIYERLNFSWCRNCRYKEEEINFNLCRECSLRYDHSSWGVSRNECDILADEIIKGIFK